MGQSRAYHVVGRTEIIGDLYREVGAMSRLEVMQQAERCRRDGTPITRWMAQTQTGCAIIGANGTWREVDPAKVPTIRTVICPRCGGAGCGICNFAGFTTRAHLRGYQDWQLDRRDGPCC
jgi:hypothetical protein